MAVQSYLVFPEPGSLTSLSDTLAAMPECEIVPADNRDLILLVTDTPNPAEERALRERLDAMEQIRCMVLAFGEIDPDTTLADPVRDLREKERRRRELPVLGGAR